MQIDQCTATCDNVQKPPRKYVAWQINQQRCLSNPAKAGGTGPGAYSLYSDETAAPVLKCVCNMTSGQICTDLALGFNSNGSFTGAGGQGSASSPGPGGRFSQV